jgi:hypothetical protein
MNGSGVQEPRMSSAVCLARYLLEIPQDPEPGSGKRLFLIQGIKNAS